MPSGQRVNFQMPDGLTRGCVHETDHLQAMRMVPLIGTIRLEMPIGGDVSTLI